MMVHYILVGIIFVLVLLNIIVYVVGRRRRRRDRRTDHGWMADLPLDAVSNLADGGSFFDGGDWGNWS